MRPLLSKEQDAGYQDIIRVMDGKMVVVLDPGYDPSDVLRLNRSREKRYAFDSVFDATATQQDIYMATTRSIVDDVLNGFNTTTFAYGATGSGKTYTMLGTVENPGISFLTMQELFSKIDLSTECTYKVTLSYIEIYNENIRDLLNPDADYLELREDSAKSMKVCGVTELQATNAEEIMTYLRRGSKNRTQEPTSANEESSRSHAVLQIVVEQKEKTRNTTETVKIGKLSLIDLAGSERASVTQNRGVRLQEGANINRSLLALGNCINALGEKNNKGSYVPFRDSKLTRLLKDSLGGNCKTIMIANIAPTSFCVEDTINTLKYANRAKNIKTYVSKNVNEVSHHIAQYTKIISDLRNEIASLKQKLTGNPYRSPLAIGLDEEKSKEEYQRLRKNVSMNFEERMQIKKSIAELDTLERANRISANTIYTEISKLQTFDAGSNPDKIKLQRAKKELATLLQNMERNGSMKKEFEQKLIKLEEQANIVKNELRDRPLSNEAKDLFEFLYKLHVLELEHLSMSTQQNEQKCTIKEKDSEIANLLYQIQLRDRVITEQQQLLQQNNITYNSDKLLLSSEPQPPSNFDHSKNLTVPLERKPSLRRFYNSVVMKKELAPSDDFVLPKIGSKSTTKPNLPMHTSSHSMQDELFLPLLTREATSPQQFFSKSMRRRVQEFLLDKENYDNNSSNPLAQACDQNAPHKRRETSTSRSQEIYQ